MNRPILINCLLTFIIAGLLGLAIIYDPEPVKGIGYLYYALTGYAFLQILFLIAGLFFFFKTRKDLVRNIFLSIGISFGGFLLLLFLILFI